MNQLTVCICVYNGEKYITETLESICSQSFQAFDLLIVNDCSTDNTLCVINDFFANHSNINVKVITLAENGGLANARRYAENIVNTEFICFIDADDIACPRAIEKMFDVISSQPDCMTASVYCEYISPESQKIGGGIFIGPATREIFMQKAEDNKLMFIPPFNISRVEYIRKAGCRAVDGFPAGKPRYQDMCEDLDLWCRMSDFYKQGKYMLVIPEVLLKYRKFPQSVSANSRAMNWRIRHIKNNLLLRRSGKPELSFIDYMARVTRWQKIRYFFKDLSSDFYKQAGFCFMQKRYFSFGFWLLSSAVLSPVYVFQKMTNNIIPAFRRRKS